MIDLARDSDCSPQTVFTWVMYQRRVPPPNVIVGKRKFYSESLYPAALNVVKELATRTK